MLYKKRSEFDPYYTGNIICGHKNGASYVSIIDMYGNKFEKDIVMSGLADFLSCSLARKYYNPNMDEATAKEFLRQCFNVLYTKNRMTGNKFEILIM